MTTEELKLILDSHSDREFLRKFVFEAIPWVMGGNATALGDLRADVLKEGALPDGELHIVGSAATGYSLSPLKAGRAFRRVTSADRPSDIDLAIVSSDLFIECWEAVLVHDRRHALHMSLDELTQMRQGIYYGFLGGKVIPRNTAPSRRAQAIASAASRTLPLRGHPITLRIYRRFVDLEGYQTWSLRALRRQIGSHYP